MAITIKRKQERKREQKR